MYLTQGILKAAQGRGAELSEILAKASALVKKMEGCQMYLVFKQTENPDHIHVTELWDSKEHHAKVLQDETVKALIMQGIPLLESMPTPGSPLEVIAW